MPEVSAPQNQLRVDDPSTTVIVMADNRWTRPVDGLPGADWMYVNAAAHINRAYARRQGYKFKAYSLDNGICGGLHPSPCKLLAVREALLADPNVKTAVFADSDAVFLDHNLSVHEFLRMHGVNASTPLVMPTDCDHYVLNAGIHVWNRARATPRLISEWLARSANFTAHPWEQEAMKHWYKAQHAWLRRERLVELIPHGEASWHVGSCNATEYRPARWLSHVTGRWPHMRAPIFKATLRRFELEPWGTLCECSVPLGRIGQT